MIQGHLEVLQKPDLYRYLKDGHEATTVGLLLGMACQYVGKADPTTNLIVRMHIPDTYDPALGASVGAEVTPACQAAALASLGLLYAASNHRQIADFLVNELGQRPQGDQVLPVLFYFAPPPRDQTTFVSSALSSFAFLFASST
jgi:anaphase-promoting complex subunit 1